MPARSGPADFEILERPSPNHDGRGGTPITMLVLHYTGMISAAAALARLTDPDARVSAHYLVDEDGGIIRLVAEGRRAWHAGRARWRGRADVNAASIGIELVNPGHEFGYRPYTEPQMAALIDLAGAVLRRQPIAKVDVVGHADVAPTRKADPGELFDWPLLAVNGIGLWPPETADAQDSAGVLEPGAEGAAVLRLQSDLATYGYGLDASGRYDAETAAVVTAFQRHFRPRTVDGRADPATRGRLRDLLALLDRHGASA